MHSNSTEHDSKAITALTAALKTRLTKQYKDKVNYSEKKKPSKHFWRAISGIRGKETPWGIVTKFLHVDIWDTVMYATFGYDRLRGLGVARGRFSRFPIDLRRRLYNTLALPCECVIVVRCLLLMLKKAKTKGLQRRVRSTIRVPQN